MRDPRLRLDAVGNGAAKGTRHVRITGMTYEHVVSVSGGVDSGATLLKAVERREQKGRPFVATFADTGNEHEAVYEHVRYLAEKTGTQIRTVRARFDVRIAAKRAYVAEHWPREGVPQELVDRAVAILQPTGNAFLDLCLWKTRFPGAKSRFCTDELKIVPMFSQVQRPILKAGRAVISWQGVRADESRARGLLEKWQRIDLPYSMKLSAQDKVESRSWRIFAYRPLLNWKKQECFDLYKRHGLKWNPLYDQGFGRVGCMLCIMAKKHEVRLAAQLCPEHIDRLAEWEEIVTQAAKRGCATFFCTSDDPLLEMVDNPSLDKFGIRSKVEWSKTSHGGLQYDIEHLVADYNTPCNTWGACETAGSD
jgi:3'-phosphoadenosine 5'-phosphosulfate sulfotransferase (PAPS reductase)/FAD synthetase